MPTRTLSTTAAGPASQPRTHVQPIAPAPPAAPAAPTTRAPAPAAAAARFASNPPTITPGSPTRQTTWTGCVTDRTQPYDAHKHRANDRHCGDAVPGQPVLREQHGLSATPTVRLRSQQIVPLSYNWTALKATIAAMQPTGGTDQAIGLAWAWQSLLQTGADERTGGRFQLHLQQGDHPAVRRPEYRRPLAGLWQRQHAIQWLDRRTPAAAVPTTSKPWWIPRPTDRCTRSIRSRSNTSTPADPTSTVLQNCASRPQ